MRRRFTALAALLVGSPVAIACASREAQPAQMEEAARGCDIRTFAAAPSNSPDQSANALHFDTSEPGIESKLNCYQARLEAMGLERTLAAGSAGFDPRRVVGLLFARVAASCGLPANALATVDGAPTIFDRGLAPRAIDCASAELRRSGRFDRIRVRPDESPPPLPTVNLNLPGDRQ